MFGWLRRCVICADVLPKVFFLQKMGWLWDSSATIWGPTHLDWHMKRCIGLIRDRVLSYHNLGTLEGHI